MAWQPDITQVRSWDWSLAVICAGFLVAVPIYAPIAGIASGLTAMVRLLQDSPFAIYDDAIAAAALKRPSYQRSLLTIDPKGADVKVVNFGKQLQNPDSRKFDLWVALEPDLRAACRGAENAVLALEQVLGLPPGAGASRVVNRFSVPATALFRPCMSGGSVEAAVCGFELPPEPMPDVDLATLRSEYDHLRFVAKQMWNSYRIDFPRPTSSSADYPSSGFPFTGMGWTYNWASSAPSHVGVSEFVVRRDAALSGLETKTPAEFCAP